MSWLVAGLGLTALIGAAGSAGSAGGAAPLPDIYVLAGQSNMSGRGALAELTEQERAPVPGVAMLGNDGIVRPAMEPIDGARGQQDMVSADRLAAVGPGLFFARALIARQRRPIILIPCAKGGSAIDRWRPGGDRTTLYGSCLARVRSVRGQLAGILWYQGESDTENMAAAAAYGAALADLVGHFRRDLERADLPFIFAQIADRPIAPEHVARYPGWGRVQMAQRDLALRCAYMVPTGGLVRQADKLHLVTDAQRRLGSGMARAVEMLHSDGCGLQI